MVTLGDLTLNGIPVNTENATTVPDATLARAGTVPAGLLGGETLSWAAKRSTISTPSLTCRTGAWCSGWDPQNNGFVVIGAPIAYDCAVAISWFHSELRTCLQ